MCWSAGRDDIEVSLRDGCIGRDDIEVSHVVLARRGIEARLYKHS